MSAIEPRGVVARNLKAVQAGLGSAAMLLTAILGLAGALPDPVVTGVTAVLGVVTTFRVWLVRNTDLITNAESAVDDLVDSTAGVFQVRG